MKKDEITMNDIYLVGNVNYTEKARCVYENGGTSSLNFLIELQNLMEEFGVVRIDICTDAFKYMTLRKKNK